MASKKERAARDRQIVFDRGKGMSLKHLAKKYELNISTISEILKAQKPENSDKKTGKQSKSIDDAIETILSKASNELAVRDYCDMTVDELAKIIMRIMPFRANNKVQNEEQELKEFVKTLNEAVEAHKNA